jgi:MoaA/NifB/PqqE/SkfB family radical SAM enzyme
MCPQWKIGQKEDENDYVSEQRMKEIIDEMKELGMAEIGFSGGEPMIYKQKLLNLLSYANKKGLYTHFATNGSLVTKEFLQDYDRAGGGHISLSVDAVGEKHDELRGYKGAYESAFRVIKTIKEGNFHNINLKINLTLSQGNLDKAVEAVEMATEHDALVFIQPYDSYEYGNKDIDNKRGKHPLWIQENSEKKLKEVIDHFLELKDQYPGLILNSRSHLQNIYSYFTDSGFAIKCSAPLDSISLDPFGRVIFCKFGAIGDIKNNSLKQFLESDVRKRIVQEALICKEGCLLGCMFRPKLSEFIFGGIKHFSQLTKK